MEVTVPESSEILPLFLSRADVCKLLGIGETTLWHLRQQPEFPKFVLIHGRKLGARRDEILEWAAARPIAALPPVGRPRRKAAPIPGEREHSEELDRVPIDRLP